MNKILKKDGKSIQTKTRQCKNADYCQISYIAPQSINMQQNYL